MYFLLDSRSEDGVDQEAEFEARTLVRTAMTAIERAYADARTYDPRAMAADTLEALEPTISFYPVADETAATSPTAQAKDQGVSYSGTQTSYAVGTLSPAGIAYGVIVLALIRRPIAAVAVAAGLMVAIVATNRPSKRRSAS